MGNGGHLALPGSCEVGVDAQISIEKQVYSVRCSTVPSRLSVARRRTLKQRAFAANGVRVSGWLMASGIEGVTTPQFAAVPAEAGLWVAVGSASKGFALTGCRTDHQGFDRRMQRDFVVDIPADNNNVFIGFWMQARGSFGRETDDRGVPQTVALNTFASEPQQPAGPDLSLAALPAARCRDGDPFSPLPQNG